MAKKKQPTLEDARESFIDVMSRGSISTTCTTENGIILSKNVEGNQIIIIPDNPLMSELEDRQSIEPSPIDPKNPESDIIKKYFECGRDLDNGWITMENLEDLFKGKIFNIKIKDREYKIPINRDLMPLKLKKSEYNNVRYKIFSNPLILAIRKDFISPVEGGSFILIRMFHII